MLHAGTQGDVAGTGLDRVAHQVPHRLGEAVGVAMEFGNAGVVVALQAYRPAGLVLGQSQHALKRGMDVQFGMRRGRGRRQQLVEQAVEALDLRADQFDQLAFAGIALGRAAGQQLGRALQPGQRVAQLVGQPLQRCTERAGQGLGRVQPGKFIDRMRFQQPAAIVAAAHPALSEARGLAGTASASRFRRRLSRSSRARKWASASPWTSSAASGRPNRRRTLTPSQRAKAGLQPAMQPSAPAQASGVPRASRDGGVRGRTLHQCSAKRGFGVRALSSRKGL